MINLATWPGLTTEAVQKYLPDSCPATNKGHMKRQRKDIRSTKDKINDALEQIETPKPSDLRGCVWEKLAGYKHGRPLPVLPRNRSQLPHGLPLNGVPRGGVPSL